MLQKDKYLVINIRKYLESDNPRLGEEDLIQILSEFSCEKNPDIERFLKRVSLSLPKRINLLHILCCPLMMVKCWDILRLH